MSTLVVGASGATGRLLVEQLCHRGQDVKVIVRAPEALPAGLLQHDNLTVIKASVLELSDAEMAEHVRGCDTVASCLGHNLTLKGVFGPPRRLVTEATRRLCQALLVDRTETPARFVLMNTAGNSNRDLREPVSMGQKCVIGLLRLLLPPHVDNEQAADFLRTEYGQNQRAIDWVVVRPDSLVDHDEVTEYTAHPSPTRSAIFNAGKTSRMNVAHFMGELITNDEAWQRWSGQMPVIYNQD